MLQTEEADLLQTAAVARGQLHLPQAPASELGVVKAWSEPIEILTYEPAAPDPNPMFLEKRVYQGSSGRVYPLPVIDRISTTPVMRSWQALHIENESIRVMLLPGIGGRIHVALDKRTGYDFIYRQNVIKPALVGLAGPWVSGGIEFNWPQHHRPATFMPVETSIERSSDGSITIWCSDHDPMERMKGMHGVCLRPGKAVMELRVRLYNRTQDTHTFLWWANVATNVHEHYQSFFPRDVHFVADHAKRAITTYPLSDGIYYGIDYGSRAEHGILPNEQPARFRPDGSAAPNDLGWYTNIPVPTSYMIVNSRGDYSGGYDHKREAGIVAIADHHIAPGKKQWTWGNHEFGYAWDRSLTDSDGPYVELMVGAYTDNQPDFSFLAPGETRSFSQYWYPIHQIGVPCMANLNAALRVDQSNDAFTIHLQTTADMPRSTIRLCVAGKTISEWTGDLTAESPLHQTFPAVEEDNFSLSLEHDGVTVLRYAPSEAGTTEVPAVAEAPAMPTEMGSSDDLYLTGLHLEQYRHPTREAQIYWEEALRRDAGDSRCNNAMGRWHLRRGELDLAEKHLRAAIARLQNRNLNSYDGEAFYNLGLVLLYRNDIAGAYDSFYKATWNAAWASPSYQRLAEIDCRNTEWNTALDHVDRSLKQNAENLNALNLKALILQKLERRDEASDVLAQIHSLDPLDIFHRSLSKQAVPVDGQQCLDLCFDLLRAGFAELALSIIDRGIEMEPQNSTNGSSTLLLYLKSAVERQLGFSNRADATALAAARADSRYVFPHRVEELLLLEDAVRQNPSDARAHFYLGNLLYDKRRHADAIESWKLATELEPQLATAWRNLAFGYFNVHKDTDSALRAFNNARLQSPHDARLLFEYDQLLKRTGCSPAERLALLQKSPALVQQRDDVTVEMASLLNSEGSPHAALALLLSRQFRPWEGGEGAVLAQYMRSLTLLAVQYLRQNNPAEAIACLRRAQMPPASLAEARHVLSNTSIVDFWLGTAYREAGDTDTAKHHFETAAAARGDFQQMQVQEISEATYWSGRALQMLNRQHEADALFEKVRMHADRLRKTEPTIDFFATSLPTLLLFEEDLRMRADIQADFLEAQTRIGQGTPGGEDILRQVLQKDPNHIGAIDFLNFYTN